MTAFTRSLRSLGSDRFTGMSIALVLCLLALGAWAAWFAMTPVTLYEIADTARLEVDQALYPVQSPMVGKVAVTHLTVGKLVETGEILVELDTSAEEAQVREEETRLKNMKPEVTALNRQINSENNARVDERAASRVAVEEAKALARQTDAPAQYNALEEERLRKLRAQGLIAQRDYDRGRADAQQTKFAAEREKIAIQRIEQEQRTKDSERDTRIRKLEADITHIEGEMKTSRATISKLRNEIEKRVVRAPIAGRLAEVATLREGAVLAEGERIGAIVPDGKLRAIAQFPPPAAMGRIAPGQHAQLRLQGFPWTQWGTVGATVERVAGEVRDGAVRVEFAIDHKPTKIPLQHGLPGSVEVEIERTTPAALVMRVAGRMISAPRPAFSKNGT